MLTDKTTSLGRQRFSCLIEGTGYAHSHQAGYYHDTLLQALSSHEIVTPPRDFYSTLGLSNPYTLGNFVTGYMSDRKPSVELDALYESAYAEWQTRFNNIHSLFSGNWDFGRGRSFVPNENPVLHRNLVGIVESGNGQYKWFHGPIQGPGVDLGLTNFPDGFVVSTNEAGDYLYSVSDNGLDFGSVVNYLTGNERFFAESATQGTYDVATSQRCSYFDDFDAKFSDNGDYLISYSWVWGWNAGDDWVWDVNHVKHRISFASNVHTPTLDTPLLLEDWMTVSITSDFGQTVSNDVWWDTTSPPTKDVVWAHYGISSFIEDEPSSLPVTGTWPTTTSGLWFTHPFAGASQVAEMIGYDASNRKYVLTHDLTYLHYHGISVNIFPNFAAGAFLSSQDALDTHFGKVEGNYIETLLELQDFLKPVDLVKAIKKFRTTQYQGGITRLLGLLADVDLTFRFGIVPTIGDAEDLSRNLLPIIRRFRAETYQPSTAYGQKLFLLTDEFPYFSNAEVLIRSKVRLGPNLDSFLPYLLPINSLGLLPSLSRIWDLIPYSWLIDNFLDLSSVGDVIDAAYLQMAYNIDHSVHSIEAKWPFSTEFMDDYDVAPITDGPDRPGYQLYVRYAIDKALPVIGPSVLPVFRPFKLPSWDLIGSLIVKRS